MTEGLDDSLKTTINRGFAWLAMSRWLLQDDAMEIFEEAEKLAIEKNITDKNIFEAINCGKEMIHTATYHGSPRDINEPNTWYYFDDDGEMHTFVDKDLGYGEITGSLHM